MTTNQSRDLPKKKAIFKILSACLWDLVLECAWCLFESDMGISKEENEALICTVGLGSSNDTCIHA